ncbi:MAG TPA: tetratricopeptide repeat protein, partial [Rhodothermales bacterium]|nr:tetratricopeptide repeat protein [Rhodothermales bacterium]
INEELADEPDVQAQMMEVIGRAYRVMGRFEQAAALFEKALAIRQGLYGNVHRDVAGTLFELAYVFHEQGDFARADSLFGAWLILLKTIPVENDQRQADRFRLVGEFYIMKRDYNTAEPPLRAALRFYQETYETPHQAVGGILRNLAVLAREQGRYAEAVTLLRDALALYRSLGQEDTQAFGATLMVLGGTLWQQGDYDEAEVVLRETLAHFRTQYGDEDYPALASSVLRLARFLYDRQNYDEAEALYREAADRFRQRFGDTYVLALRSQEELADVLRSRGAFEEAEALLLKTLAVFQEQRGQQHPYTQGTLGRLTALYEAWEKPEAAVRYRALLDSTVTAPPPH